MKFCRTDRNKFKFAISGFDWSVKLFDANVVSKETGELIEISDRIVGTGAILDLDWSGDDTIVFADSSTSTVTPFRLRPDGSLAALAKRNSATDVMLTPPGEKELSRDLTGVQTVSFSPESPEIVMASSKGAVYVYDFRQPTFPFARHAIAAEIPARRVKPHGGDRLASARWCPARLASTYTILTVGGTAMSLWDLRKGRQHAGKPLHTVDFGGSALTHMQFSDDHTKLAVKDCKRAVYVLRTQDFGKKDPEKLKLSIDDPPEMASSASFHIRPTWTRAGELLHGHHTGSIVMWRDIDDLISRARSGSDPSLWELGTSNADAPHLLFSQPAQETSTVTLHPTMPNSFYTLSDDNRLRYWRFFPKVVESLCASDKFITSRPVPAIRSALGSGNFRHIAATPTHAPGPFLSDIFSSPPLNRRAPLPMPSSLSGPMSVRRVLPPGRRSTGTRRSLDMGTPGPTQTSLGSQPSQPGQVTPGASMVFGTPRGEPMTPGMLFHDQ
ncbi:hypothetical protein J8273_0503 [Carpediemonas membranifera]|uniref:Uncharacterized protein n=1 Tax=Carpediemonas membranifera TaxID=201153 RepID=A0A8J6E382_9EUKA|nr:hypothetical protein J8273_0503 [Carpediemonas membranifera]|eukprot:KAG9395276.1 hypothetical protein J8273_0503 [Carpediemonas membranifera]